MIDVTRLSISFDDPSRSVRWYRVSVFVEYDDSNLDDFYKHMDSVMEELERRAPCRFSGANRKELMLIFGTFDDAVKCLLGLMKGIDV